MTVVLNTPNLSRHPRTSKRAEVRASATVMTRENAPIAMLSGTARDMNASNSARVTPANTVTATDKIPIIMV